MGPDFNDDGRVDGYDMEYLDDSRSEGGDAGCGDVLKIGCLAPLGLLAGAFAVLACLTFACSALAA